LTYHPPVEKTSSQHTPRQEETAIQSSSTLFNRIATELDKVPRIVQRMKSQDRQSPQAVTETYVAPRTPEEELLANVFADVLGLERVGIHDDFFESGGHSLIGTQVMSRIHDAFAVKLPLNALFEAPTAAQLSTRLNMREPEASLPSITRVERNKPLPLSFAQQRLWFLDQLEGKGATYNLTAAVRLEGQLNPQALEHSLQALIRRHESLRTSFPTRDGAPVAQISDASFQLDRVDLRTLSDTEQDAEVQRLLKQAAMCPFDLTTGPLFRTQLFQLGASSHILQIILHHIIADGWPRGVFVREWRVLYETAVAGEAPPLPPLPVQYVDFASWQRQWLTGEVLDKQLRHWKQQLADAPALLELPTDYPRPPTPRYSGASLSFSLPDQLTALLKAPNLQTGMTLWSAFAILLSRYSGQTDIIIGSPIANRTHRDLESLIGFFVNSLVLRLDLSGNPSFEEVLRQARQVALDAYAHQDIPFERLVEALQPERNLSHAPFFQVMFVLQNAPLPDLDLPGLNLTILELESSVSKFDLTLEITETAAGLTCRLEYCTDLFERTTIERLAGHLQTLLTGIVDNPDTPIHALPLLTEAERQQLATWNDTAVDYPQDKCVHQVFEAQAEKTPEAIAVVCEDQQLTYRELNTRANRLAHHLQTLGVKPEVLVGICLERSLDMVIGLLSTIPLNQSIGLDWDEAQWMTDVARIVERLLGKALALSLADFRQLDPTAQLNLLHETLEANDWAISRQQLSGLIETFKANCQAGYVPQAIPPVPIALFIVEDTLTETASGVELERLRAPLKQQADWGWRRYADGPVDIHVVPGGHHTMMSKPHVRVLAEKLSMCLNQSESGRQGERA